MNIYRTNFVRRCPNNGKMISYVLEIRARKAIMVEDILTFCAALPNDYHEKLAGRLHKRFGGQQILKAFHHGVEIETRR